MKDRNTLTIHEVFVNWQLVGIIQYMLDKMRHKNIMAISPLSIFSNWCNPKGRFWRGGGLANIYIYICFFIDIYFILYIYLPTYNL